MRTIILLKFGNAEVVHLKEHPDKPPFNFHATSFLVYTSFQIAKKYLHYYATASNGKGHGIHSPFVFEFVLDVLNNRQNYQPTGEIETLRKGLLQNKTLLQIEDLGAGSRKKSTKERSVSAVAKTAVKSKKWSFLFFRLAKKYGPQTVVELGTSLGVTTAYLASAAPESTVITLEGSSAVQQVAQSNFDQLGLKNIQSIPGLFDVRLPQVLAQHSIVNLAYIDGNHRYAPTIDYFHQLLQKKDNNTIMIFDDIHWSVEMEQAWAEIKQHPSVRCTIDVFFLGFVFFKEEFRVPQHFTIRF